MKTSVTILLKLSMWCGGEILDLGTHCDDIPEHGDDILLYLTITCR